MANPEHLKILKQGVEVWNKWREENPEVRPDLSGVDFNNEGLKRINAVGEDVSRINLSKINFSATNLSDADLSMAFASRADFSEANLYRVNLSRAILFEGSFNKAIFLEANLLQVDIYGANLNKANLCRTNLSGANFSKSNLFGAQIVNSNLERACFHHAILLFANLSGANLSIADFSEADLSMANLSGADLSIADFSEANLSMANLSEAKLHRARFYKTSLFKADLTKSDLSKSDFSEANLIEANLFNTDISKTQLVGTDFSNAILERTRIYGISAWDIKKDGLIQKDLIITPYGEPEITVDDLEVAQFIYLMLNNEKIRNVIETITSKAVLILGRFTPERKAVLDAIKDELRLRNYLPIIFDFENTANKSVDETINLLARMSRFVIADITDAKSIPQELRGIVPDNPSVPIVPLIWKAQHEYGMFDFFRNYPWVLPLHEYESPEQLLENIIPAIIEPAEQKVRELKMK